MSPSPDWAEQVTAVATAVGAVGLLGTIGAAAFAGQQVREARRARQAEMAADFIRRWNDDGLVEARRLVAGYSTPEDLRSAFSRLVAENAPEAFVLYREPDYFEQLGALVHEQAIDFTVVRLLLGPSLVNRWQLWRPSLEATHGDEVYPMFRWLAEKMQRALGAEAAASS